MTGLRYDTFILDDIYNDFSWYHPLTRNEDMTKNFYTNCQYYATQEEAVKAASRAAVKSQTDVTVFKAIKLVSPKTPEVDVTDVTS